METRKSNSNYSDEMVDIIINTYESAPTRETVEELAAEFDRPVRGIIAKLSQNGVYQKQERSVTKAGAPVVRKGEIVAEITQLLGVHESDTMTLVKASKADLLTLKEYLTFINAAQ